MFRNTFATQRVSPRDGDHLASSDPKGEKLLEARATSRNMYAEFWLRKLRKTKQNPRKPNPRKAK